MFYCGPRTLINSFEMHLTVLALYFWPGISNQTMVIYTKYNKQMKLRQKNNEKKRRVALIVAAIACMVRPTNVIIWVPFAAFDIYTYITFKKHDCLSLDCRSLNVYFSVCVNLGVLL